MEDKRFSLYHDKTQEQVEALKAQAQESKQFEADHPVAVGDVVHDVVFFIITSVGAFGWMMLMELLISFIAFRYIHFQIGTMVLVAVIFAVVVAIFYIVKKSAYYYKILHKK